MAAGPDITGVEGERLDATVTVDSTFSSQQTQTIELRIEDGGTTVHTDTQDVTLADSTDSQQITLSWPTSDGDKGVYDLFIESDQDTIQRLVEVTASALPSSAIHRWKLDDVSSGTVTDSIGSVDGTVNGVSSVSGTYQGGSAGQSNASSNEQIDMNASLSQFARDLTTSNFSFAYTIDGYTGGSNDPVFGGEDDGIWKFVMDDFAGGINLYVVDGIGDRIRIHASDPSLVDDGNKHRVVWLLDGFSPSNWQLYVDGAEVATTVNVNEGINNFKDESMYMFGSNKNYLTAILDDLIIYDALLTASEVTDDYNAQPWS